MQAILSFFEYKHLPPHLAAASAPFCELAYSISNTFPATEETYVCLRKLLEAKDCAVRAALSGIVR